MLTLIHGDDTNLSRNYYMSERQNASQKKIVDGNSTTLTELMQIFSGNGLFGDQEVIFIEELVSKRKSQKDSEELVDFITKQSDAQVFIWESKLLTPKQTNLFKKASIKEFKIPLVVFTFLDALKPGNTQQIIKLYHEVLTQEDAGYILAMLIRQIRILLSLSDSVILGSSKNDSRIKERSWTSQDDNHHTITEITRMSSWQMTKMQKQAKLFTQKKLLNMHTQLFELEKGQKTGTLTLSLPDSIDFFLLSI